MGITVATHNCKPMLGDIFGKRIWEAALEDDFGKQISQSYLESDVGNQIWKSTLGDASGTQHWTPDFVRHVKEPPGSSLVPPKVSIEESLKQAVAGEPEQMYAIARPSNSTRKNHIGKPN